jgi:hypothetical protein
LHELNGRSVGTADVNDALAGIRTCGQRLRFAGGLPAGLRDFLQHRIEIVYGQRDVDVTNVAGSKIDIPPIRWREVLQQLDLVAARGFQYRKLELSAFYSRNLLRPFACLMRGM